ncbi:predicted protein [Histoplasma mississippiense (nom. inval.)]|uniref:predicted protein n=1 Tax=Ajellomyces capsulatus (strain NAm1 / WU24) TaxID=2059318 RepID=UPI000157BEF9|nr:predicted protein [Histoplasma mississippiense (nom. inval.)]EDN06478.1 predicted protein [Histoplasma mississippiense (nom. inval.)]
MALCGTRAGSDSLRLSQDDARFAEHLCLQVQSLVSRLHQRGDCQPFLLGSQLWQLANGIRHIAEQYARDHISFFLSDTEYAGEVRISDYFSAPSFDDNDGQQSLPLNEPVSLVQPSCHDMTCVLSDVMPPPLDCYELGNAASRDPPAAVKTAVDEGAEERDEAPTAQSGNTSDSAVSQDDHAPEQLEDKYSPDAPPGSPSSNSVPAALRSRPDSVLTSKMAHNSTEMTAAGGLSALPSKLKRNSGSKADAKADQPTDMLELCTELAPISHKIFEPDEVYRVLVRRSEAKHHQKVPLLVRLFFAVASPLAFKQLAEACEAARERHNLIAPCSADDAMLMKALDALDSGTAIRAILRRFFLVQLLGRRHECEKEYKKGRRSANVAAQKSLGGTRDTDLSCRADSSAFRDLLIKFYPHLKVPDKRNPLADDNVLCEYRGAFLQEVGHLVSPNIEAILYGHDIGVKYEFEHADRTSLVQESMDSQRIIGFCQPVDVSDQSRESILTVD